MQAERLFNFFGIGGLDHTERPRIRRTAALFETLLLGVAFWLPIQWYLEITHQITPGHALLLDWLVWAAFASETLILTLLVKRKIRYLATNWLNLVLIIAIFPLLWQSLPHFAALRFFRVIMILRLTLPWMHMARKFLSRNHLGITLIVTIVVTCLSGLLLAAFDPGIKTPFDGIWWAWETVTTVGYGDVLPSSTFGRLIAIFVMLLGLGIFSLLTANLSAFLIGQDKSKKQHHRDKIITLLESLHEKLDTLNIRIENLEHKPKGKLDDKS